jgi:hypothetical protein
MGVVMVANDDPSRSAGQTALFFVAAVVRYLRGAALPAAAAAPSPWSTGPPLRNSDDDLTRHYYPGGIHAHFGVDLTGLSLQATDIDWTFG